MTSEKKESLEEKKADAARLKACWLAYKKDWESKHSQTREKLTQEMAAEMMGFSTQAAFSHYVNGTIPMSMETVMKFAEKLECKSSDIRPSLKHLDGYVVGNSPIKNEVKELVSFNKIYASGHLVKKTRETLIMLKDKAEAGELGGKDFELIGAVAMRLSELQKHPK